MQYLRIEVRWVSAPCKTVSSDTFAIYSYYNIYASFSCFCSRHMAHGTCDTAIKEFHVCLTYPNKTVLAFCEWCGTCIRQLLPGKARKVHFERKLTTIVIGSADSTDGTCWQQPQSSFTVYAAVEKCESDHRTDISRGFLDQWLKPVL